MFWFVKVCPLEIAAVIISWTLVCARPLSRERTTSRSYFSRCGRGTSSNLERLSSTVPIKKLLASFDISTNVAFFRLESCSSYSICFITKTQVISRKDFGAPNTVLWSKLVNEYQVEGKKPEPFSEVKHRPLFTRSKLEDSCLHGFYVIGSTKTTKASDVQKDSSPAAILTRGVSRRERKRRKKKRKPRRNNSKRNRHKRRKLGNRRRSAHGCKRDEQFCTRRCIGWRSGSCIRLQISCSFLCPAAAK